MIVMDQPRSDNAERPKPAARGGGVVRNSAQWDLGHARNVVSTNTVQRNANNVRPIAVLIGTQEDAPNTTRFELACAQCSAAGSSTPDGVEVQHGNEIPSCEELPTGAKAVSSGTTVESITLEEGYYRTSNESHVILECHRRGACVGGVDANNYCAAGFEGPCKCSVIVFPNYRRKIGESCTQGCDRSPGSVSSTTHGVPKFNGLRFGRQSTDRYRHPLLGGTNLPIVVESTSFKRSNRFAKPKCLTVRKLSRPPIRNRAHTQQHGTLA